MKESKGNCLTEREKHMNQSGKKVSPSRLRNYLGTGIRLLLFCLINLLVFVHLLEKDQRPVLGIESRKILLLLLSVADLIIAAIGFFYKRAIAKSDRSGLAGMCFLVSLSPIVGFLLLESMTGNLTVLPFAAIWINILLLYLILLLFLLFFQNIRTALTCFTLWIPLLGLVQYYIQKFRGRSFMLTDISSVWTAAQVAGGYSYAMDLCVGIAALASLGWLYLISVTPDKRIKRFSAGRKVAVILLCVLSLHLLGDRSFAAKHTVLQMDMWNTEKDYRVKGYLLNLLAQIQYLKVEEPENYTEEQVQDIAEKYRTDFDAQKVDDETEERPTNLIVIMNESWADFRIMDNGRDLESVTPYIDQMEENVTKGWLRVPAFGGGTAYTEYEMLTGNSEELLEKNPPVAYQVHSQKDEYGLASTLAAQNFETIAMHPHSALNYNRKQVYPRMGFDKFISKEMWPKEYKKRTRKFINDQACYDYLEEIYQEKETGEKLFTFLVTMQNHAGYSMEGYDSTVKLDYEQEYPEAEQYFSLIKESDAAFESLIRHFEKVEEPTMIVMFGDHWPNIQDGFYDMLMQTGTEGTTAEENRKRSFTPFVIWTNYERESEQNVVMSVNYFSSYILEQMGAELTDYNKFLLEMKESMPVIAGAEVMTADGEWYPKAELPKQLGTMLNEYEILQYNNMFAKGRKVKSVFSLAADENESSRAG